MPKNVPTQKTISTGEGMKVIDFMRRRAGDSNPEVLAHGGFQDRCLTS